MGVQMVQYPQKEVKDTDNAKYAFTMFRVLILLQ